MVKGEKHITLREAAELSGYSPDYLGQLIRKGKLQGEQVFSHVAWVTTEDAVRDYMENNNTRKRMEATEGAGAGFAIGESEVWGKLARVLLWVMIVLSVTASIFLFYVLAVAIDDSLEERAIQGAVTTLKGVELIQLTTK